MLRQQFQLKDQSQDQCLITYEAPITFGQIYSAVPGASSTFLQTQKEALKISTQTPAKRMEVHLQQRLSRIHKRIEQFTSIQTSLKRKFRHLIPALPIRRDSEVTSTNAIQLSEFLNLFLKKSIKIGFQEPELLDFLEIMPEKISNNVILATVDLRKQSGGRYQQATFKRRLQKIFCCCVRNWRLRCFRVIDEGIFYTEKRKSFHLKQMLPFSQHFKIRFGIAQTGQNLGIILISSYRQLNLYADSVFDYVLFISIACETLSKSPYKQSHRFNSFAPIRSNCHSQFFVDGEDYFSSVCNFINQAKKSIFITDWMMTPYFQLKRPAELDDRSVRLDYVLESAALRGVAIYIILYMQPKIALNNDSENVQKYFNNMHPNIKVLRHPNYILIPFLWSHHQKIVIVDQQYGFLGGLDLCYGRWDNSSHRLSNKEGFWKGADFCNFRISDIYTPRNFLRTNLNISDQPRLPWHDVAVKLVGTAVHDLCRHFIEYWNFVSFQTQFDDRELLMGAGITSGSTNLNQNALNQSMTVAKSERLQVSTVNSQSLKQNNTILTEQQYYERCMRQVTNHRSFLDLIQINRLKQYPNRLMSYLNDYQRGNVKLIFDHIESHDDQYIVSNEKQSHQILRSASSWSIGLQQSQTEKSIYNAYLELISQAQRFIYIQNQFFIGLENQIIKNLAKRVLRAYHQQQEFKVIVIMPLLPGFEGDISQSGGSVLRVQLYLQFETISRGQFSFFSLISQIPNPQNYIKFYSLRAHDESSSKIPITEILYIHSKLMIVDDKKAILGSANINDRSMLGNRDSQIAVLIQQEPTKIVSSKWQVAPKIHNLRIQLYVQHFALTSFEAVDPCNPQIWNLISHRAQQNTRLYRIIFGCYPDDTMIKMQDIDKIRNAKDQNLYYQLKDKIIGHVVELPLKFLKEQDLSLKPSEREYFLPLINFT